MASTVPQRSVGRYEIVREVGRGRHRRRVSGPADRPRSKRRAQGAGRVPRLRPRVRRALPTGIGVVAGLLEPPQHRHRPRVLQHQGNAYIAMRSTSSAASPRGWLADLRRFRLPASGKACCPGLPTRTQGIVHRDLKPENVMVTGERRNQDRGFRGRQGSPGEVRTCRRSRGRRWGRLPTWRRSRRWLRDAGPPADLYAVGVLAYEMLSGPCRFAARRS